MKKKVTLTNEFVYAVGKIGKCICGCYLDHLRKKDPYLLDNTHVFMWLRRVNYGNFGKGHYDKEETVLCEKWDNTREPTSEILLIDKYLNPMQKTKEGIKTTKGDFYILSVDLTNGEKLIYDK